MKTLSIVVAAALASATFATGLQSNLPTKYTGTIEHGQIFVGPDRIGHVVTGPGTGVGAQAGTPRTMIYNGMEGWSNYYFGWAITAGVGLETWDDVPQPGLACIDQFDFAYVMNGTAAGVNLDMSFFDDANLADGNELAPGCGGCLSGGGFNTTVSFVGLPLGGHIFHVTLSSPITILGPFYVSYLYSGDATVTDGGPFIDTGLSSGIEIGGTGVMWPWGNFWSARSSGASGNNITDTGGCWWWGCRPVPYMANIEQSFYGQQPWMFMLAGDYGINGPLYDQPVIGDLRHDRVWVNTADNTTGEFWYQAVKVYQDPDSGETWGGLPFGTIAGADTFTMTFLPQDAYLSASSAGQLPNLTLYNDCVPAQVEWDLVSGDINGDNAVNLIDLGIVLGNYNKTGT